MSETNSPFSFNEGDFDSKSLQYIPLDEKYIDRRTLQVNDVVPFSLIIKNKKILGYSISLNDDLHSTH